MSYSVAFVVWVVPQCNFGNSDSTFSSFCFFSSNSCGYCC